MLWSSTATGRQEIATTSSVPRHHIPYEAPHLGSYPQDFARLDDLRVQLEGDLRPRLCRELRHLERSLRLRARAREQTEPRQEKVEAPMKWIEGDCLSALRRDREAQQESAGWLRGLGHVDDRARRLRAQGDLVTTSRLANDDAAFG